VANSDLLDFRSQGLDVLFGGRAQCCDIFLGGQVTSVQMVSGDSNGRRGGLFF
jgi:hypothetical protein